MKKATMTSITTRYLFIPCIITLLGACGTAGNMTSGQGSSGKQQDLNELKVEPALIVRQSGDAAVGYYRIGRRFQEENRLHQAIDAYRKAIALDNGYVDAHSALGTALAQQGQLEAAATQFRLAVELAPQSAYLHNNLGYLYYLQGKPEAAAAVLTKAVALDRANARSRANLALVHQRLGAAPLPESGARADTAIATGSKEAHASSPTPSTGSAAARPTLQATAAASAMQLSMTPPATGIHAARTIRFEIADGSKIEGLAGALVARVVERGLPAPLETRQLQHSQRRSVILYRKGHRQAALQLGAALDVPIAVASTSDGELASGTDLKLVIGRRALVHGGDVVARDKLTASLKTAP